jgi:hypothetical protein
VSGTFSIHDTKLGIWTPTRSDTTTYNAIRALMYRLGFSFHGDPTIPRILRASHHIGKLGDLHFVAETHPALCSVEFFEDVVRDNPNGARYDFNKLTKMPYLLRLRTIHTLQALATMLCAAGFADDTGPQPRNAYEKIAFTKASWVKSHGESFYAKPPAACNSKDRDGATLTEGDTRFIRSSSGRLIRGVVFYDANNMWMLLVSRHEVHYVGSHQLFSANPRLAVRKISIEPRGGIGRALNRAINKGDWRRADEIQRAITRIYGNPDLKRGDRVWVDNPRYHGEGAVAYVKPGMVGVLLENGNTWDYETATVIPMPAAVTAGGAS